MSAKSDLALPGSTARTRIRRLPQLCVDDRSAFNALLDVGLVAHVAMVDEGQPYVLPVAYGRDGDRLLIHGSTGSRLFRALAAGVPACVTITVLDGMVLARSVFESSMNYRSAMVLGSFVEVAQSERSSALELLVEKLVPGRWAEARPPSRKELAATSVLAMPLDECSLKVSAGGPTDPVEDMGWPVWAGVVPLVHTWGVPVPAGDLAPGHAVPDYVGDWSTGRS